MTELLERMAQRRSVRAYTGERIPETMLEEILEAGMLAPTGKNTRSTRFLVVQTRETLDQMAGLRPQGAGMLHGAAAAIVVLADAEQTDTWVEDASIAAGMMHLAADAMGLGSCWVQVRLRQSPDGRTVESGLRALLGFPEGVRPVCILSLGWPVQHPEARPLNGPDPSRVRREHW